MPNSLIEYHGSLIERKNLELYLLENVPRASSINLASDILTNNYGMKGFLLTDHQPEDSRFYWPNGEYGATTSEDYWQSSFGCGQGVENLRTKCKSVVIPGTFKLVRYIVMPQKVNEFFSQDKFLGEPMIEKIMKEDVILDNWCDPNDWEEHKFPFNHIVPYEKNKEYKEIIENISPQLQWEDEMYPGRHHRAWQSFHLYQDYPTIINVAQESLIIALTRFDQFLERTDRKKILDDQKRNVQGQAEAAKLTYLKESD